jgi:hypothetical protein
MRAPIELDGFDFYFQDNWDGDGAEGVKPHTFNNMKVILSALPNTIPAGSAMAGSMDGSIGVYWAKPNAAGQVTSLYLDLRGNGRLRIYYTIGKETDEVILKQGFSIDDMLDRLVPILKEFE